MAGGPPRRGPPRAREWRGGPPSRGPAASRRVVGGEGVLLLRCSGVIPAAPPIDLTDPAVVADPYPSFARARAQAPVQWHQGLGLWLAFTHDESNAVLRDRRLGRIWRDREPAERFASFNLIHPNALLEMEPPDHTRPRRLVSAAFAHGHVERLRPWVQRLAGELVDGLAERSG